MTSSATYRLTIADFLRYGHRYCIDYRFPVAPYQAEHAAQMTIAQGRVEETLLFPGVKLVLSDLDVLHSYASNSRGKAALLILVVAEGRVRLGIGAAECWLTSGQALTLHLSDQQVLCAHQPEGQRLRTLSLAFDEAAMHQWCGAAPPAELPRTWSLTNLLLLSLEHSFRSPMTGQSRQLFLQGLALQLLAQGVALSDRSSSQATASSNRLETVRRILEETPERDHSLEALAAEAAMSSSTLVRHFKAAYGCSPINYLRRMRLALARELLLGGHSVQQAAHLSGYRYASNFITAFRRTYGVSPGSLISSRH